MAISFDGENQVISLSLGTTSLSVRDLWSRWVDWFLTDDNSKFGVWMTQVGGDDIDAGAGTKIPIYIFLASGVKIKPQEANHTLAVTDGILLVAGGGDPFKNTTGAFVIRINYQQPVQAISFSAEGGGGLTPAQDAILTGIDTKIGTPVALDSGDATIAGMLTRIADGGDGSEFDRVTDNLMEIAQHAYNADFLITDIAEGGFTVNEGSVERIADAVWDEATADHVAAGSFGAWVQGKLLTVAKFLGLK